MAVDNQHTLSRGFSFEGKGLHTGALVHVDVLPADVDFGICFERTDIGSTIIPATYKYVVDTTRSTVIAKDGVEVNTIEHIMSALWTLGVDNALIKLDGPELPILDGSAEYFVSKITEVGVSEQTKPRVYFHSSEPIYFHSSSFPNSYYEYYPAEDFRATVLIDYSYDGIGQQFASYDDTTSYGSEIASARTFVLYSEIEGLIEQDLIKGGDLNNAVVFIDKQIGTEESGKIAQLIENRDVQITEDEVLSNLRYTNEPARHKLLDLLGDLAILGKRIKGHIIAKRPGHTPNADFVRYLADLGTSTKSKNIPAVSHDYLNKESILTIQEIQNYLPHRYPFLLVDKVVELSENHIVGIKNVTFNESFFQGHFPGNPVFPGVLMIEALAQTGGVLALAQREDAGNWDTYFAKVDNFRFKKKVIPGDVLIMELELTNPIKRGIVKMKASCLVGDEIVAHGELTAQIIKRT